MVNTIFLREFSQLLLKHGASLEDLIGMAYTQEELDPQTKKYNKVNELVKNTLNGINGTVDIGNNFLDVIRDCL
jgi:hypothetical protein